MKARQRTRCVSPKVCLAFLIIIMYTTAFSCGQAEVLSQVGGTMVYKKLKVAEIFTQVGNTKVYNKGKVSEVYTPATGTKVFSINKITGVFTQASGTKVYKEGKVTIDASHTEDGYVLVKHSGSNKRLRIGVSAGGTNEYFELNGNGEYESIPLVKGSGTYMLTIYELVKGSSYAEVASKKITVQLSSDNAPYLCPSQYVWYTEYTDAVAKSYEICEGIDSDYEKMKALYNYVSKNVNYDYIKALTINSSSAGVGYLPDVDETLSSGMGICFDYSALLACMLRVQGIPVKLVIGNLLPTSQKHAWNQVYVDGSWYLLDATFRDMKYGANDYSVLFTY